MSLITRTDVTAVKFHNNFILAGIGGYVNVFEKESTRLLDRFEGLQGHKIYGFMTSKCNMKILVFGGKQFTVLSLEPPVHVDKKTKFTRLFEPVTCDDWLHSSVWLNDDNVALLTAHNVVQIWNTTTQGLKSQHCSMDNSVLYSGLLLPLQDGVLVFAGTVFSDVIIHCAGDERALHHMKGHRGVIFSISCEPAKGIIVTTSDDRSVRIWNIINISNHKSNTKLFWENAEIVSVSEVYGHMARVMRNCINNNYVVSVGEDSVICFWDFEGKLLRKLTTHQNSGIWSVDCDNSHLVTGGGDAGVILHPLTVISEYGHIEVLDLDAGAPKKIVFTARRNIVILNEENLIYYNVEDKSKIEYKLEHESTYKLLSISSCKQIIAVGDMHGKLDICIENCKDTPYLQKIVSTKLQIGKILSMQWAGNRHLVLCSECGLITVLASKGNTTEVFTTCFLPSSKERWLTASAIDSTNNAFVLGDRCGNIHIFVKGQNDPIKTFSKVHGRYGPTSITVKDNEIITTGRDGTIKSFTFNNDVSKFKYISAKELDIQWVEKFLDKNENMICGFQERVFVVYDIKTNSKLLEVNCGGGHRAWDAVRFIKKGNDDYEEFITLIYIKKSDIYLAHFELSKIASQHLVNGSHSKEINCLKTYRPHLDPSVTYFISGGEDTTLRISSLNSELCFKDEIIHKQLSCIRTLRIYPLDNNLILVLSAGGRAQICIKLVKFDQINDKIKLLSEEVVDYLIKGTDKERKGNQNWRNCSVDFDPETRIMDIDIFRHEDKSFTIFAGCSDAYLRIFKYTQDSKTDAFKLIKELKYHKTCILKTDVMKFLDKHVLVTCSTRGEITFWDVNYSKNTEICDPKPVYTTRTNKSGINCFTSMILSVKSILIVTGGDDNAIHLNVLEASDQYNLDSLKVSHQWDTDSLHSSQITGLCLFDDILISTAIDQRITLCRWKVGSEIECHFVHQVYSDVADLQGMDIIEYSSNFVTVCVFGKGVEVWKIPINTGTQ